MYAHVYKSVKFSERISTMYMQWNPCDLDTIGPEESVLIREVSRLKSTQTWYLGRKKVS